MNKRKLHLINGIRVWLNRATAYTKIGKSSRAEEAVRSAMEVLNALEQLELKPTQPKGENE